MKKILELIKKLFGKKELAGKAVEVVEPVVAKHTPVKKKPAKKKKKNDIK